MIKNFSENKKQKIVKMTWTYEKFIKELEKHGICIEETEEEFNAIVAAEKARVKKGKFEFKLCKFKFIFPGNKIERMMVCSWERDKKKPPSERKAEKSDKAEARANDPENNNMALKSYQKNITKSEHLMIKIN